MNLALHPRRWTVVAGAVVALTLAGVRLHRERTPERRDPAAPEAGRAIPPAEEESSLEEEAHQRAARLTRRSEGAVKAWTDAPMRSLSRAAAVVLMGLGIWMLVGQ